jgi:drug/metabolite transporter (DMT)-like permease
LADSSELKGYALAGTAYLSGAVGSIGSKVFINASSLETTVLLWYFAGGVLSLGMAFALKGGIDLDALFGRIRTYLGISIIMTIAALCWFASIDLAGPSVATFVSQLGIVIGVLLGAIVLRERLTLLDGMGSALAIAGAMTMTYQSGETVVLGVLLALVTSVGWALQSLLVKRYVATIDKVDLLLVRSVTMCVGVLGLSAVTRGLTSPSIWLVPASFVLAGFGFVAVNFLIYHALSYTALAKVSVMSVIEPLAVVVGSLVVFGDVPGPTQLTGGLLILIGVSLILVQPLLWPHPAAHGEN